MTTKIGEALDRSNMLVATFTNQLQGIPSDSSKKVSIFDEEKINSVDQVGHIWLDKDIPVTDRHKGVAVIIGNSYTREDVLPIAKRKLHSLRGSLRDADMFKKAFDYLEFLTIVKLNVSEEELMSFLYPLAHNSSLKSYKRFVFAFSGHGGDGFVCSEDEKKIEVSSIVDVLTPKASSDPLVGIPRLFFFDTCRGEQIDSGFISRGRDEMWKHKIPSTGDMLVAFATTPGYKAFEEEKGGVWTNILTNKLVTSFNSIYDILTEVNKELIIKLQSAQMGSFQQPELIGRLNSIICLLKESGKPPMSFLPPPDTQPACVAARNLSPKLQCARTSGQYFISPKSLLNEFCQSKKFSLPKYSSNLECGIITTTVCIRIEGKVIQYSYQYSKIVLTLTKKLRKECEECAAEIAYSALTKLYGAQSYQESSSAAESDTTRKAKSQLNELFQRYNVGGIKYHSWDGHNFKSTLSYTINGRRYQYNSRRGFSSKQEAEEDAAKLALCDIKQQLRQPFSRGSSGHHYKSMLKEKCSPRYITQPANGGFVSVVDVPQYGPVIGPVGCSMEEAEKLAAQEALRKLDL
ncbi:uncharacterized protein [Dysidea avara]